MRDRQLENRVCRGTTVPTLFVLAAGIGSVLLSGCEVPRPPQLAQRSTSLERRGGPRRPATAAPAALRAAFIAERQREAGPEFSWRSAVLDGVRATNAALAFTATTSRAGLAVANRQGREIFSLHPATIEREIPRRSTGRAAARMRSGDRRTVEHDGNRVTTSRRDVAEWFVNGPLGLEHGFDLSSAPPGRGRVVLTIALEGATAQRAAASAGSIVLDSPRGRWTYGDAFAHDATGRELAIELRAERSQIRLLVEDRGARYPITIDPLLFPFVREFTAREDEQPDQADGDEFGIAVAISGDLAVVGAHNAASGGTARGAAYVFSRNQGSPGHWGIVKRLTAPDGADGDRFGYDVAVSGDRVLVGALLANVDGTDRGAAYLFERDLDGPEQWGLRRKLVASDRANGDLLGTSVSLSGDLAIAGAYASNQGGIDRGAAYVFAKDEGGTDNWGEAKKLTASDAASNDWFGIDVAISGTTAVIGAYGAAAGGTGRGAAYVFDRDRGGTNNWGEAKKLVASDAANNDFFGGSVAIDGDVAVVGASWANAGGADRGAAYVFSRDQGGVDNWGELRKLVASDGADNDFFGQSVSIRGANIAVGAYSADGAAGGEGAVYVFSRDRGGPSNWGQLKKRMASDGADSDYLGYSVAIDGDTVLSGAYRRDLGGTDRGAVYVFERNLGGADNWGESRTLVAVAPGGADFDSMGSSVAISADLAIVGAQGGDATNANQGTAYVFARDRGGAGNWGLVTRLAASDGATADEFGQAVAIGAAVVAVGANVAGGAGAVYLFGRDVGGVDNWGFFKKIVPSDMPAGGEFGFSLSFSGDLLLVGARRADDVGAAYLYERNHGGADNWGELKKLTASDGDPDNGDQLGWSVVLTPDLAFVSAYTAAPGGAVYVFAKDHGGGDNWGELKKITASDAAIDDYFGQSLSLSGTLLAVGAGSVDVGGYDRGAVYLYERDLGGAGNWGELKKIVASDGADNDALGQAVGLSHDVLLAGSGAGGASTGGAVYVFRRDEGGAGNWGQLAKLSAPNGTATNLFGNKMAVSEGHALIGAQWSRTGGTLTGSAYLFDIVRAASGGACAIDEDCATLHCADGVCCDSACGGGAADCQACDVVGHEGTCTMLDATVVCRAAAGVCDEAETCDGATPTCPGDAKKASTTPCRPAADACDAVEQCDGIGDDCPTDELLPDGTFCGPPGTCQSGQCVTPSDPTPPPSGVGTGGCSCNVQASSRLPAWALVLSLLALCLRRGRHAGT